MSRKKSKLILCMDFDGVIHSYISGFKGSTIIPDDPVEGAFDALKEYATYFKICIFSSRSKRSEGVKAMKAWFIDHGWPADDDGDPILLEFPSSKPAAFVTLDDRAITFKGKFPGLSLLKNFTTWHQKEQVNIDKSTEAR